MGFLKKTFVAILLLGSMGLTTYEIASYLESPCDEPLKYSIGRLDSQFGISKNELKLRLERSESVWESAINRELFVYDDSAPFKINLVYDERQMETVARDRTESGLDAAEKILRKLDTDFVTMKKTYESDVVNHKKMVDTFEAKQATYSNTVNYWNSHGGAPVSKFAELEQQRISLNQEAQILNNEVIALNAKAKDLNRLLSERNNAAEAYNLVAKAYNQKYGKAAEFDQAVYVGDAINIYQFETKDDLDLAIAHELGHALGMGHVENQESIMYYISKEGDDHNFKPTPQDITELNRACKIK